MTSILLVNDAGQTEQMNMPVLADLPHDPEVVETLTDLWDMTPGPDEDSSSDLALVRREIRRKDYALAGKLLDTIKLDNAEAFNLHGAVCELAGEFEQAFRYYRRALKAQPSNYPAQMNLRRHFELRAFGTSAVPIFL